MTTEQATVHFHDSNNHVTACGLADQGIDPATLESENVAAVSCPDCRVAVLSDRVMRAIERDIAGGVVPPTVRSFSRLEAYVDANMYLENAGQEWEWAEDAGYQKLLDETNAVTDEVDRRLQARE